MTAPPEGKDRVHGALDEALRTGLKRQYHAALAMLREAIESCPDPLWFRPGSPNGFWQIAYHAVYFTHLYLHPDVESFRPWSGHDDRVQHPDGMEGPPDPKSPFPLLPAPYPKEAVLEYWAVCDGMVDAAVDALALDRETSGFPWYAMSKLEHQVVNIRHVQHHAAQLSDRLRLEGDDGVRWVKTRSVDPDSGRHDAPPGSAGQGAEPSRE